MILSTLEAGQIGGIIVDPTGAVVPDAEVTVSNTQTGANLSTTSDGDGHWVISGMQPGPVKSFISLRASRTSQYDLELQARVRPEWESTLEVASVQKP